MIQEYFSDSSVFQFYDFDVPFTSDFQIPAFVSTAYNLC